MVCLQSIYINNSIEHIHQSNLYRRHVMVDQHVVHFLEKNKTNRINMNIEESVRNVNNYFSKNRVKFERNFDVFPLQTSMQTKLCYSFVCVVFVYCKKITFVRVFFLFFPSLPSSSLPSYSVEHKHIITKYMIQH